MRCTPRSWSSTYLCTLPRGTHYRLRLCEDIAYNMRRVHGTRHPVSLEMYEFLAQLYTAVGQQNQRTASTEDKAAVSLSQQNFRKSLLIHKELPKLMVYEGTVDDNDEEDETEYPAAMIWKQRNSDSEGLNNGNTTNLIDCMISPDRRS